MYNNIVYRKSPTIFVYNTNYFKLISFFFVVFFIYLLLFFLVCHLYLMEKIFFFTFNLAVQGGIYTLKTLSLWKQILSQTSQNSPSIVAHQWWYYSECHFVGWLQICSSAEKRAIDKMIDSGPQLAGSMEYNVVLSECRIREAHATGIQLNEKQLKIMRWLMMECSS